MIPRTIWSACRGSTPKIHGDLDRLVELGIGPFFHELHRFGERIGLAALDPLGIFLNRFSQPSSSDYSTTSRPIDRADPAISRARRVDILGVEVRHLLLRDLAALRHGHPAHRPAAAGLLRARLILAAFFRKYDAGGAFISKVKVRSWYTR